MLAVRGMQHHLKGWKLVCNRRYYAKKGEGIKHLSPEDNAGAKRAAAAKALAQTSNPAVLKTVESVIKGMRTRLLAESDVCALCTPWSTPSALPAE